MIADPGHRQVRQHVLVGRQPVELDAAAGRGDQRVVREAHTLRLAGRSRRVDHHRHVLGAPSRHLVREKVRVRFVVRASQPLDAVEAVQEILRVVTKPARVVEDDVLERGAAIADLEELVDLLLVLDDREMHLGVVQHIDHLRRDRILVERHRHAAQRLRGGHRPVEPRPVVADDREVHPALEALRRKPAGQRAHLVLDLRPGPGLPDPEILLAGGRVTAAGRRVVQQQARERIQCGSGGHRFSSSNACPADRLSGRSGWPDSMLSHCAGGIRNPCVSRAAARPRRSPCLDARPQHDKRQTFVCLTVTAR